MRKRKPGQPHKGWKSAARKTLEKGVTSEMREAGASVLLELSGVVDSWVLAERVYAAMKNVELVRDVQ